MTRIALVVLLLSGCTEYILATPDSAGGREVPGGEGGPLDGDTDDGGEPDDSDPPDDSGEPIDDDDPGTPEDTGDPGDPTQPPEDEPPRLIPDDCPNGVEATFSPDEIYVLSWNETEASGTLTAPSSDWFEVYSTSIVESGASQFNESAYFRVSNATVPHGLPAIANCRADWIVQDADNSGFPSSSLIYIGTFWLDRGDNSLTMYHYCPRFRDGECTVFHNNGDADTTCDSGDANSVHFSGYGLCLRRTD